MKLQEILKLGAKKDTGNLDDFIKDFYSETSNHPFDRRIRLYKDTVGIEVSKFDGMIHLSSIINFDTKRTGGASKALKWLCELADKHKVAISLSVQPIKNAGSTEGKSLTKSELKAWYTKNGFESKGGDGMIRQPK